MSTSELVFFLVIGESETLGLSGNPARDCSASVDTL